MTWLVPIMFNYFTFLYNFINKYIVVDELVTTAKNEQHMNHIYTYEYHFTVHCQCSQSEVSFVQFSK